KGRGRLELGGAGMADLARSLSLITGRTVVDETGMKEVFTVHLTFSPDDGAADGTNADTVGPSIFTAVQGQLGLKLESAKGPVDVLVIDHVEQASEN
ncbi:MAG TPA: TIGR03435 family protein, partial [Acidisoma sp.]|nr:TIGR03435 family protein [Acidisoma sp.]